MHVSLLIRSAARQRAVRMKVLRCAMRHVIGVRHHAGKLAKFAITHHVALTQALDVSNFGQHTAVGVERGWAVQLALLQVEAPCQASTLVAYFNGWIAHVS